MLYVSSEAGPGSKPLRRLRRGKPKSKIALPYFVEYHFPPCILTRPVRRYLTLLKKYLELPLAEERGRVCPIQNFAEI